MKIADPRRCELVVWLFSVKLNVMGTFPSACQGGGPQFKYDYFGGLW